MRIRPATRSDIEAFYGRGIPMTARAIVGVDDDDKPIAVGGYFLKGDCAVAFTDISETVSKRDVVRGGRMVIDMLRKTGLQVYARSDTPQATALKHFGFEPVGYNMYRWTP